MQARLGIGRRITQAMTRAVRDRGRPAPPRREFAQDATAAVTLVVDYAPKPDGRPDPGEVVWTWVPYEDDASRGKDRPVLIIGRVGGDLAGLLLTSKDHDRDA